MCVFAVDRLKKEFVNSLVRLCVCVCVCVCVFSFNAIVIAIICKRSHVPNPFRFFFF